MGSNGFVVVVVQLSICDHFDEAEVLQIISIWSFYITTVCWLLCNSCNSICPSELLPASAASSCHNTKHNQFLQIVSVMPGNVTKILQTLLYNCIKKESGSFSSFKQETLNGPIGCQGNAQRLSPTPSPWISSTLFGVMEPTTNNYFSKASQFFFDVQHW